MSKRHEPMTLCGGTVALIAALLETRTQDEIDDDRDVVRRGMALLIAAEDRREAEANLRRLGLL